jgi:hypothetical protein
MARPIVLEFGDNHTDNYHAAEHDDGATKEHGLATNLVDDQLVLLALIYLLGVINVPFQEQC